MKYIQLTQNQKAIVDDWWFDYLNQWKWYALWADHAQSFYAVRNEGPRNNQKMIMMHRVIAKTPPDMFCDHIHHNTLDNREDELRNVTRSQSQINTKVQKNNKLGIKGVFKRKGRESFLAVLYYEKKRVFFKAFKTVEEAKSARLEAEKKYFGEYRNNHEKHN